MNDENFDFSKKISQSDYNKIDQKCRSNILAEGIINLSVSRILKKFKEKLL